MSRKQLLDLLSVWEVAELLGIRECTVRAWILQRKLPYLKIGRSVRVERSVVETLMERSRVPARPGAGLAI